MDEGHFNKVCVSLTLCFQKGTEFLLQFLASFWPMSSVNLLVVIVEANRCENRSVST